MAFSSLKMESILGLEVHTVLNEKRSTKDRNIYDVSIIDSKRNVLLLFQAYEYEGKFKLAGNKDAFSLHDFQFNLLKTLNKQYAK